MIPAHMHFATLPGLFNPTVGRGYQTGGGLWRFDDPIGLSADGETIRVREDGHVADIHVAEYDEDDRSVFCFAFGQISPTYVLASGRGVEDCLEKAADFLERSGRKGCFVDMKEAYEEAKQDLERAGLNPTEEQIQEAAEVDLTYTESGYLVSYEWGIAWENDPPRDVAKALSLLAARAEERNEYPEPPKWL